MVILLGLLLFAAEAGIRAVGRSISVDLEHIGGIPALAEEFGQGDGLRVLFLGNSLTRAGLDPDSFELAAKSQGLGPLGEEGSQQTDRLTSARHGLC